MAIIMLLLLISHLPCMIYCSRETYTSRFSTGGAVVVEDKGVDGPLSIAVDWIHDRLYWLSIRQNTVESTSLNGTDRTLLIDSLVNTLYPNNIAVDPYEK